ncbi:MAG TPA: hypothetical protein VGE59_04895 [Patescibacteria group bacterium]
MQFSFRRSDTPGVARSSRQTRVARRPPPKISVMVYFAQAGKSKKVGSFKAVPGAKLGESLRQAGVTCAHEHPEYPDDFITAVNYRRWRIVASHDPVTRTYVWGVGSQQITFKVNGDEFINVGAEWYELPNRSCRLVVELEDVIDMEEPDGVSLRRLTTPLPGSIVFGGA